MTAMNYGEQHDHPMLSVFTPEQVRQVHAATMEVLAHTGFRITHPGARALLEGAGASVTDDRVRLPVQMVENAIQTSPSSFAMGKPNGEPAMFLEESSVFFGAALDAGEYLDPETDQRRKFTSSDCRVMATIANALPNYSYCMTLGFSADVPASIANRVAAKQALTHSEKPLVCCCGNIDSLRAIYDMAVLIAGSEERFRMAPSIATLCSAISPLSYDDDTVDKIFFCAEKGIPQISYSGLQAGATSPATFAGTIVQGSAESLGGLVMSQLARKGSPVIYGAFTTIMDMATAVFSYGAPEMSMMNAAMAQLSKHYNLPFFGTAGCSDAKYQDDPQAVAEATLSCLSAALSHASLVHDLGLLDHSELISPAYLVMIDEVLSMVRAFMRGVSVNDETLAIDQIDRVGPRGHYLAEDHTMRHFRDVWYPQLFERSHYETWRSQGAVPFSERLRQKTRDLMSSKSCPLPNGLVKELDRMAAHWEKE